MSPSSSQEAASVSLSDEDRYFNSNPPPKCLDEHMTLVNKFLDRHAKANRRVVLVTSGGTTVPLERQTVRFIDNFSAGTRGATSAEYFLDDEADYAVIFLHRQFSLQPYSRHYSHATDGFLDFLTEDEHGIRARDQDATALLCVLRRYRAARDRLLALPFVTITDYLFELRAISRAMHRVGSNGLLYLAAAVSDFFLPPERMSEHKIQSTDIQLDSEKSAVRNEDEEEAFDNFDSSPNIPRSKRLVIDLDPVPKFLKNLVDNWSPQCMVISFKLETDPQLLIVKAKGALDRYQHNLVIGNLLSTRKHEVVFVTPDAVDWLRLNEKDLAANIEIEGRIVPQVVSLHDKHIQHVQKAKAEGVV
ncbi:phosphopantothenate-cysteine ligase [Grosmannia clavigera kw1407]|uniref:Phosphopantothenate-cysteine ligase n=1 Tax=Grosmannia clavigera (strain kw1407 / UAMH 11150) TaxID=655863 RepID=F0XJY3_GROCL|nr:phosphopantothenate-cysteine ligase [Grosmannia clavigera kw1407]EFX01987.1 phosphopantothenate-cysteine ligase [Grosmannia clavigera kw1407]